MPPPDVARRDFLHRLGTAAAAPLLISGTSRAATPPAGPAEPPFVHLAVATICLDGFSHRRHEPAFRLLPEVGVPNVEFNVWYPETLTPPYFAGLRERCTRAGLRPVCVQGSAFGAEGPGGVLKDVGHKLALMYGARTLGCRRIKCTGAPRGTQGGLQAVIEVCKELAPAAKEMDQLILLENHAKSVLETIADYDAIFSAIDSPHIGLCLDTGHFEGAGISLREVVERFSSRLLHIDLKDCAARGAGHRTVPFGEGVTDFGAFLDHALGKGYRGYLVIEMAWAQPRDPVVPLLRRAKDLFQPYVRG